MTTYDFDPNIHPHTIKDGEQVIFGGVTLNDLADKVSWAIACGYAHAKDVPGPLAHEVKCRLRVIKGIRTMLVHFPNYFVEEGTGSWNRRNAGDRPVPGAWFEPSDDWEGRYSRCVTATNELGYTIDPNSHDARKLYADLFWEVVKNEKWIECVNPDTWARAVPVVKNLYYTLWDEYRRGCYEPKDPDIEVQGANLARMAALLNITDEYRPVAPYGKV